MFLRKVKRIVGEIGMILGIGVRWNIMPEFRGVLLVMVVMLMML
jgi:hypothetical protein